VSRQDDGTLKVLYGSGLDILRNTPKFFADTMKTRLDGEFAGAYRYVEPLYGGRNPYMEAIETSLGFLDKILETQRWQLLRRDPPVFTWEKNPLQNMRTMVINHLRGLVTSS
jgi:hypothetical protein